LERRFQPPEVKEPTVYETLDILSVLSPKYEEYHGVEYTYNALLAAAKLSNRYISDRFLPDKAIDLIDEAGSMVKMAEEGERFIVTEDAIAEVISQISRIPLGKLDTGEKSRLRNLEARIEKRIKGQSAAVRSVAKSIRRARSGMRDGKRPVARFLFCRPTGVGKVSVPFFVSYSGSSISNIASVRYNVIDRLNCVRLLLRHTMGEKRT
jgi:ATP-dependent Clp protease ATP-binding subunit ClpA